MSDALAATNAVAVVLSDEDFEDQIEDLALNIQYAERETIFRIASLVAKARELFLDRRDEGGFRGWVERQLGYSRSHAYRLIAVDRWLKSVPSWDSFDDSLPSPRSTSSPRPRVRSKLAARSSNASTPSSGCPSPM